MKLVECSVCKGTGKYLGLKCKRCRGTGKVNDEFIEDLLLADFMGVI